MKYLYSFAQLSGEDIGAPKAGEEEIMGVISLLSSIAGVLAVIFIIVGALKMVASGGNPEGIKKARQTILYAVIGLLVSVSAITIVSLVTGQLSVF